MHRIIGAEAAILLSAAPLNIKEKCVSFLGSEQSGAFNINQKQQKQKQE